MVMLWIISGTLVLGFILCCLPIAMSCSNNMRIYYAAPIPLLAGLVLITAAVVLAIGNAAVKALL